MYRGFDHGDEPNSDLDCRMLMQSGPNFRKDLTTIIKAPIEITLVLLACGLME